MTDTKEQDNDKKDMSIMAFPLDRYKCINCGLKGYFSPRTHYCRKPIKKYTRRCKEEEKQQNNGE